ncbi:PfkB family carbohydrate kinase [Cellulomonas sp. McL0617]|uniref:PfkB family carbohydrate kinase n=1 Tax=Cellulomonas sp. McL0617 TaxID=3415675 RepID=UPI003CEFA453
MASHLVCCGLATLDVVQVVDRIPGPNEKLVAHELTATFGGPAANAAATAVALGVRTVLVTALGSGPVADLVRAGLVAAGVEVVDLLEGVHGASPAVSTVLVTRATGERAVVSVNATGVPDLAEAASRAAVVLEGAGALLVDGHHLAAAQALAEAARAPVLLDGGSWKPGLELLLRHVDHAVLSSDFAIPDDLASPADFAVPGGGALGVDRERAADPAATRVAAVHRSMAPGGEAAPADATPTPETPDLLDAVAAFGPRTVARSTGPGPVRVRVTGPPVERFEILPPTVAVEDVVDTLGAGDVLHGAIAASLARGAEIGDAIRVGVQRASESVRHAGALGWVAG